MNELDRQIKRLWEITRVNKPWLLNDKEYMTNIDLWFQVEKDPSEIIYYNEFVRVEDTQTIKKLASIKRYNVHKKLDRLFVEMLENVLNNGSQTEAKTFDTTVYDNLYPKPIFVSGVISFVVEMSEVLKYHKPDEIRRIKDDETLVVIGGENFILTDDAMKLLNEALQKVE